MAPGFVNFEGHRLAYETFGSGKRAVVLIHGLLMSKRMQQPLAQALAAEGNLAIIVDLAGHGKSSGHMQTWSIPRYAAAIEAMLEELQVKEAVAVGTSLGANISLQLATDYPDRVRGLVLEMPALENAMIGGPIFFGPFAAAAAWARPVADIISGVARLLPDRALPTGPNIILDLVKRDPGTTVDVLKGLYYGQVAPSLEEREAIDVPALVIGHKYDPIHPYDDAEALAEAMPNSRLLSANSIVELRTTPARLTGEVIDFVDDCWRPRAVKRQKRTS